MPEIDPTFTALPYRELGAVALGRAQELGASHADFRFERIRHQHLAVRDGVLQTALDADDVGFAVRVIHRGSWGFASGVVLTTDEARRVAETAIAVAEVAAEMTSSPVEIAPEPVYADVTWVSSYDVNPFDVPIAEKAALLIDWTERLRQGAAVDHATASVGQVQENKYYADLAGTVTTQQRVRVDPERRGDGRRGGHLRLDAEHRLPGRPRLGVPHHRPLRLGHRARRDARAAGREAQGADHRGRPLRPGHPPVEPVADHPRVDRPRHRARPRARLRGQLRRHVVRDLRQAQHAAVRLQHHERHRRPHRRARPGHDRVRRRGRADPDAGTSSATASWSATSSTARWAT